MNAYIHLPFCRSKCGYCAFYSEVGVAPATISAYLEKLDVWLRDHPEEPVKEPDQGKTESTEPETPPAEPKAEPEQVPEEEKQEETP